MLCDDFKNRYDGLPIAVYARDWSTPLPVSQTTFCHNHREIEMVCILQGEAALYIHDTVYTVRAGDTFFASPYDLHYTEIQKGSVYVNRCICFDASLLQDTDLAELLEEGTAVLSPVVSLPEVCEAVCGIYDACLLREEGWRMEVQGRLLLLFALLRRKGYIRTVDLPRRELFCRQVLTLLQEKYMDPITSADVAAWMFLSQGHFCRQFKSHFGDNFSGYLRRFRLEKSLELLCETSLSITAVARAVGMDDPSYYTKCFRETFEMSPREYRSNMKRSGFSL